jgi:hypothetical protein
LLGLFILAPISLLIGTRWQIPIAPGLTIALLLLCARRALHTSAADTRHVAVTPPLLPA